MTFLFPTEIKKVRFLSTPDLLLTFCLKSLSDFIDESLGKYK